MQNNSCPYADALNNMKATSTRTQSAHVERKKAKVSSSLMDVAEIRLWKAAANEAGHKCLWSWIVYVIRREIKAQQRRERAS